jgi:predicted transcriptional regulator
MTKKLNDFFKLITNASQDPNKLKVLFLLYKEKELRTFDISQELKLAESLVSKILNRICVENLDLLQKEFHTTVSESNHSTYYSFTKKGKQVMKLIIEIYKVIE